MSKDIIVIPYHNGKDALKRLLETLPTHDNILVVDCLSTEPDSIDYFDALTVAKMRTPFDGWVTGALLWVYWFTDYEGFLIVEDSMEVQDPDFLQKFQEKMPKEGGAVAWAFFDMCFDSDDQKAWVRYHFGDEFAEKGIFGPIFYTTRKSLDILREKGFMPSYPVTRGQAQGDERLWPTAFYHAGLPVVTLYPQWDAGKMSTGEFGIFKKNFLQRDLSTYLI